RDMVAGAREGKPRKSYPTPDRIGYAWLGGRRVAIELAAAPVPARPVQQAQAPQAQPPEPQEAPQANPQSTPQPTPQLEPEVQIPQDDTVVLELDSRTGYRADANTLPQNRIERRVPAADVALYDPPEFPAPLPNSGTDGSSVESIPDNSGENPISSEVPFDEPSSESIPDIPLQEVSPVPDNSGDSSSDAPDPSDPSDPNSPSSP
ncbi:MAG: hypothetical protein H7095_07665, partial [Pseudopedobacter sp.]|nr:hypothetical protein [Deinococcales bacterium]